MRYIIQTLRLTLISCNEEVLRAVLSDDASVSDLLKVTIAPQWNYGGEPAFRLSLQQIENHPEDEKWMTYLAILKLENKLIGSGSYKGKPSLQGLVEIGYGIAPSYRCQGFATEMAKALIQNAFEKEVKIVMAHTLAEENGSVKVLRRCGMRCMKELIDPEEGKAWRWEIEKT